MHSNRGGAAVWMPCPRKHFDTSGKSAALFHRRAIVRTAHGQLNGCFGVITGELSVIAGSNATKQSNLPLRGEMDCFAEPLIGLMTQSLQNPYNDKSICEIAHTTYTNFGICRCRGAYDDSSLTLIGAISIRAVVATAVCITSIWLLAQPAFAESRVALVIGNGAYEKVPELPNPTRDAADIGRALERLNFKVTQIKNATAHEMRKAVVDFGRAAEGAEMAVVFYAGHGMEVGGENWLIPTSAELRSDADTESEAVSLRWIRSAGLKGTAVGLRSSRCMSQ